MFGIDLSDEDKELLVRQWFRRYFWVLFGGIVLIAALAGGWRYNLAQGKTDTHEQSQYLASLLQTLAYDPSADTATVLERSDVLVQLLNAIDSSSYATGIARVNRAGYLVAQQASYAQVSEALGKAKTSKYPLVQSSARLVLARAAWGAGQLDDALEQLDAPFPNSIQPIAEELRGDILLAKGQIAEAGMAYNRAATLGLDSPLLTNKRNMLGLTDDSTN